MQNSPHDYKDRQFIVPSLKRTTNKTTTCENDYQKGVNTVKQ